MASLYLSYFAQFLKGRLSYRVDFFASIFVNLFVGLVGLLFIVFLVDGDRVSDLRGWRREELLFVYGYSMLPLSIFGVLAPNLYSFGDRFVIKGYFDIVLMRPLNSLSQVLFESFNLESVANFILGLLIVFYALGELSLELGVFDLLWLFISSISGAVIILSVFVVLASLSFHFEDRMGVAPPFYNLMSFSRYPLTIYNGAVQFVLSWVVPFAFASFFPATHFLGRGEFFYYCYFSPFVAAICALFAAFMWNFGVSRYSSTGT